MPKHQHSDARPAFRRHGWSTVRTAFASIVAGLLIMNTLGFTTPSDDDLIAAYTAANAQPLVVAPAPTGAPAAADAADAAEASDAAAAGAALTVVPLIERPTYSATPGYETLISGGTNYDWAKLVLLKGEFPMTDSNVTVLTRWMRQENYVNTWWNRNNPLNNGWGSGGGGGTGRYVSLVSAAENAAEALRTLPRYSGIVAALEKSVPTAQLERAIWFSGWATGMYNNGAHWSYAEVPVVKAPPSAWGR